MLIVEGPDCVGKTTLCRELLKRLPGYIYAHFSRLPEGFDYYWGYIERISRRVVQDRFHMSEIAYSRARGDEPRLTRETYRLVDAKLRLLGGFTVLITAERNLIASRWRKDQMYSLDKTLEAARIFEVLRDEREEVGVDIDYAFHCTEGIPYVPGTAIDQIIDLYRQRRSLVDALANLRPPTL